MMMVRAFSEEDVQTASVSSAADAPVKLPVAQSTPKSRLAQRKRALELAIEIARLLDENKCSDVLVLEVHGLTQVQDYIVIASGTSERQMRTCTGDIKALVDLHQQSVYRADKDTTGTWQVIDCVDVVVHLFEPNTRGYYDLESRWGDAPRVAWERPGQARSASSQQTESRDGIEESETFGDEVEAALAKKSAPNKTAKPAAKKLPAKAVKQPVASKKAPAKPAAKNAPAKKVASKKVATKPVTKKVAKKAPTKKKAAGKTATKKAATQKATTKKPASKTKPKASASSKAAKSKR